METVTIGGDKAVAVSPEGQKAEMPLAELMGWLAPPRIDTGGITLPDGVKAVVSRGPFTIFVHQTSPRVFNLKWIAKDSKAKFGPHTRYRTVRIAQPYIIVLAAFGPGRNRQLQLTPRNECFYRAGPLNSLDDELLYPALLNCSKFPREDGNPLSWICTQHLDFAALAAVPGTNERIRTSIKALMHCLLETGFNNSSEEHEGQSHFGASRGVDSRVDTVEAWERATEKDPLFVLEVPWLTTGRTVRQVCDRMFEYNHVAPQAVATAGDIARLVFNRRRRR